MLPPFFSNNNSAPYSYHYDEEADTRPLLSDHLPAPHPSKMAPNDEPVHCHGPDPDRRSTRQAQRQLAIACVLCFLFVVGELLGGYYSGSLAIMADAAHMFSDFASFGVSLFVIWLSGKKPRKSMTFGFYRAEALGALATVVIIWYVTGILTYLAIERLNTGEFEIHDNAMVGVASAAVLFNITLGLCLHGMCCTGATGWHGHTHGVGGGHGHSHGGHSHLVEEGAGDTEEHQPHSHERHINIRAALIHVLGDLLQSIGVLISSVLIKIFGESCKIVDPICTLIFACIVLATTLTVLRDTLRILAEGTPARINYDKVKDDLSLIPDVAGVHDLHVWSLTADLPAAAVHLTVTATADYSKITTEATNLLRSKYKIQKSTVQVESHKSNIADSCLKCQPLDS